MKNVLSNYSKEEFYRKYSEEELKNLYQEVRTGNVKSRNKLVTANMGLVINIAKCYINAGIPFEDLIQEGILGLINAIDKFDIDRGIKLSTYATWWIKYYISYKIKIKCDPIKLPLLLIETVTYIHKNYILPLSEKDKKDIMKKKKISNNYIQEAIDLLETPISKLGNEVTIDKGLQKEGNKIDDSLETISNDIYFKENILKEVDNLEKGDGTILKFFFGIGCMKHTIKEIGEYLNMDKDQVIKRKEKLLRILKKDNKIIKIKKELDI